MPVGAKININIGKGGYLGAYLGMQNIAQMPRKKIEKYFYKKSSFNQLKENSYVGNPWSNPKPHLM